MHLSGLIIRTGYEKENSQTSKNIHKTKIDVIYQFSLRKNSAKAVSSGFIICRENFRLGTYLNNQQVFEVYEIHIIAFVLSSNDENKFWL